MLIGMILASDKETIVPIIEGEIARIYDTNTKEFSDSPNPALGQTEGRRGATVKWMVDRGVKVLCAPPSMLCELSYTRAQEEQFTFYRLEPGTTFEGFKTHLENGNASFSDCLPENEIEPSAPIK
ncbi:hypothetical protein V7149_05110 [Bacillus sp. JJ1503]|uniref:hypothetical protein n=1 Tax=Bacillus sp. JJ1503 TaxID=3122956 RepID=UPI00300059CB